MRMTGYPVAYWPEIDGFRAVAVLSVFVFHLNNRLLGGGFIGVDVFFVISGYLITTLLLNDLDRGSFSILRFYQRRVARIAPASFLVLAITIIAGCFIYSAQDLASLGANITAACLSVINIKLLFQGNYFKISPDAQPLIHYWSLAVEEQFYIIFPVFLYGVLSMTRRCLAILCLCCAFSFAACVALTPISPTAAFYLLPTRAWELLAGACLAAVRKPKLEFGKRESSLCLIAGFVLMLLALTFVREEGFPGWVAALPAAGSIAVLSGIGNASGYLQRVLAGRTMTFIGRRSYSLYLWHWPIFSFVDYRLFFASPLIRLTLKIIIAVGATLLTYDLSRGRCASG